MRLSHGHRFLHGCDCCCCDQFDPDYQAVLDFGTLQGYTLPSEDQQLLQNQHLIELKEAGIWNKLDIYYVFATNGDRNFAKINWKNPAAHYISEFNIPTFTTNEGFQGNGTNSYLDTNYNPFTQGINYTLNNASRYVYCNNIVGGSTHFVDGTTADQNVMARASVAYQRINQGFGNINANFLFTTAVGMKSIHRTSSTNVELFNDTTVGSRTATSTSIFNGNQLLLRNIGFYASSELSMYAMGASLVAENTAFVNSFNTYRSSI